MEMIKKDILKSMIRQYFALITLIVLFSHKAQSQTISGELYIKTIDVQDLFDDLTNEQIKQTKQLIENPNLANEYSDAFLGKHYNNSYSSFKDLYSQYINDTGLKNYSHDIMKDQFINRMAIVLQNYDNKILSDFEDYKILASQGVFDLTPSQKIALNAIKTIARNNDTKCKD